MKKQYPSKTRAQRAAAHTRRLARKAYGQYGGTIECWYDKAVDDFYYYEFVGSGYVQTEVDDLVYICSEPVYEFDY